MRTIKKLLRVFSRLAREPQKEEVEREYSERQQKHPDYIRYVNEHLFNVDKVWSALHQHVDGKFGIEFWIEDCYFFEINNRIRAHDESKFSHREFYGYAQWFYPKKGDAKNEILFTKSWNHHQKANDHHWQYWLMYKRDKTVPLPMPYVCMMEMLCDWGAMSLKFKGKPSVWYEKEKGSMLLHEDTCSFIERWLPKLDNAVELARGTGD